MAKAKTTAPDDATTAPDSTVETTVETTVDTSAEVLAEIVKQNESQPGHGSRDFQ